MCLCVFVCLSQLSQLKQRLEEAEAERDKLLEELKGGHGIGASDSEDMDEMLDFPGMQSISIYTSETAAECTLVLSARASGLPHGHSCV